MTYNVFGGTLNLTLCLSLTSIGILCKKINAFGFLALTMFDAEYRLPLNIFWPKLTHHAARFLCDI